MSEEVSLGLHNSKRKEEHNEAEMDRCAGLVLDEMHLKSKRVKRPTFTNL